MLETFLADVARARTENYVRKNWFSWNVMVYMKPTTLIVGAHRLSNWSWKLKTPVVKQLLKAVSAVIRRTLEIYTGVFIAPNAEIGPGFVVHNTYGVIIGATRIGKNFTIASGAKVSYAVKSIGDDVSLGMNCVLIENCKIGSNVRVAPNSLVVDNVPDNMTVMGVPARIRIRRTMPKVQPPPATAEAIRAKLMGLDQTAANKQNAASVR